MMDIIQNPNPLNEKYTEKHHIIPRFIYRDKNIDIDNSDDNIINLSIKNHISILRTLGNIKLSEFENKIDEISNELADTKKLLRETPRPKEIREKCKHNYSSLPEEIRKEKFGKKHIGNQYRKGKINSKATRDKISKNRKGKLKGHYVSPDTRLKISQKAKQRKIKISKESREKAKIQTSIYRKIIKKEYEEYKINHKCTWNEYQKIWKDKIEKLYIEYNNSCDYDNKLSFKNFKKKYYEECK